MKRILVAFLCLGVFGLSGVVHGQYVIVDPLSAPEFAEKWNKLNEEIGALERQLADLRKGFGGPLSEAEILDRLAALMREREELLLEYSQPDTTSPNWKKITDEVAVAVFTDRFGRDRGTLFVKVGKYWKSIALDGVRELGPHVLPGR